MSFTGKVACVNARCSWSGDRYPIVEGYHEERYNCPECASVVRPVQKVPGLQLMCQLPDQDPVVGIIVWHDRVFIAGKHTGIYEYFEDEPASPRLRHIGNPMNEEDLHGTAFGYKAPGSTTGQE